MVERKFLYRVNAFLMVIIFLAIIVFVNLISEKNYKRIDLTKNKIYSISPQTKKIIKNLNRPIEIIIFYKDRINEKTKEIFEQYKSNSKFINYRFVDLDREILLAKKYGITSYDTILIISGDKYEKIYSPDEKNITSTILKLTKEEKKKIYFTIGHGEKRLDEKLSVLKEKLEQENYIIGETLILRDGIPEDCDILVICGPEIDFVDKEIEEINIFINKGKRILLFLEPGNFTVIKNFLYSYGIKIDNDIVIDLASRRFLGDPLSPLIIDYPYHEITKEISNSACIFSSVRSVSLKENLQPEIKGDILAKTSSASWAEKNLKEIEKGKVKYDENDEKGPIPVAVIVEKEIKENEQIKKSYIAVFGDSDFISDKMINFSVNKDLVLNTINYLAEEDVLISIREKKEENQPLILTEKAGKFLFFLPVVIIPILIIILGGFITIRRKLIY
ncbi:MAG: GldG family protein [Candidatus Omnitrophica bacterium]|nr:GldG family protein [Candidatus Omnitrophota bacterium]MCM8809069.1 GldG family protein [Candidatus Omnitrophota bacterium]MCM8810407.1 GldG family protein [Candidatus Omnitrophota bacterium]MCM8833092.1 GldG family protein [Candidatus Omnitrophota bacterium]